MEFSLAGQVHQLSNQEVNNISGDLQSERSYSRLNTRIHLLYKEMEFLLEFCFVLIVVSSAFIVSIMARKIHLNTE